ncbi:hypothetical protein VMCG_06162 [Cytospora schulzeri]|uniref:MaoC-like domain-containing protein n=1 Tax=Cytospora schulzeri TaxID=448051 RepID=A0A423W9B3_9PEZI|nr:hypothetical protein VMCG_06162 [Valsa malicola]
MSRLQLIRVFGTSQSPSRKKQLPLQGITVVSLEHAIAAPFCTRQLADLGARVIKVERPGSGDFARAYDRRVNGQSSHFIWTNRSKESLALDLKTPKHLGVLKTLVSRADVLVQNLAPGASARMGLSYDALKEKHPGLIVCDISGYGSDGPYRDRKAYDLLVQSEAGVLSVTGTPDGPARVGVPIADISAGMYALVNILGAIIEREKTGQGKRIDISMLESMAEWMSFPLYYTFQGQPPPTRAGAAHATIYPYGPFTAGDGGSLMLGLQNEREWARLCSDVLGDPDLASDPRFNSNTLRVDNQEELRGIIYGVFSRLTAQELLGRLDRAGIANAKLNDMQGVWEHPQLRARGRWTEVQTPGGRVPALIPPGLAAAAVGEEDARMDPVPALGEHNGKIFAELGTKIHHQTLDAHQLQKLSLTLNRAHQLPPDGTPLPPGYHLVYFTPAAVEADLSPDGTDRTFNAPAPFVRRMWAGGRMRWTPGVPLRVGEVVEERTRLVGAVAKRSRVGGGIPERRFNWSPVALFRFSALTFNAHMIHYNESWTRGVEGHPDVVVHGPLNLICMLDYFRDVHGEEPREISYRALSPLYAGDEYTIRTVSTEEGEEGKVWEIVVAKGAEICMKGTVLTDS